MEMEKYLYNEREELQEEKLLSMPEKRVTIVVASIEGTNPKR